MQWETLREAMGSLLVPYFACAYQLARENPNMITICTTYIES